MKEEIEHIYFFYFGSDELSLRLKCMNYLSSLSSGIFISVSLWLKVVNLTTNALLALGGARGRGGGRR
jgi:hypothetical protein